MSASLPDSRFWRVGACWATTALVVLAAAGCSWCKNDLRAELPSPGGLAKVVVFYRDCGGAVATAWGPQVALLADGEQFDADDTVGDLFRARVREGVFWRDSLVSVERRSDTTLVLRYDPRVEVRFAVRRFGDVNVEYEPWAAGSS